MLIFDFPQEPFPKGDTCGFRSKFCPKERVVGDIYRLAITECRSNRQLQLPLIQFPA